MFNAWTRNGKIVLFVLPILLIIVVVPVPFVLDDYSKIVGLDIIGFLLCFIMVFLGIGVVSETEKQRSSWKNREVCVFFILSSTLIACSAWGYTITQTTLDQMHFTMLVDEHPINLLAGYQAWNYTFTSDNYDDLLIEIDGYASAPCPTDAKIRYTWAVYQDGTYMYGGDVNEVGGLGCEEDNTSNQSTRIDSFAWNFKKVSTFNISITFLGVSFPENSDEYIFFTISGTRNFSGIWFGRGTLRFHYGLPLGMSIISVIIAILSIIHIENVRKLPPSTPGRDLRDDESNSPGPV